MTSHPNRGRQRANPAPEEVKALRGLMTQTEFGALVHCSQKAVLQWELPLEHPEHRHMHPAFFELACIKLGVK